MRKISNRRALLLISLTVGVILAIACVRIFSEPATTPEREGDRSAAAFADQALLTHLRALESRSDSPEQALTSFFLNPAGELNDPYPFAFNLISHHGGAFEVVIYRHVDETPSIIPFTSGEYWGRACRSYVIENGGVTADPVTCPAGVSVSPLGVTDG